MRGNRHMPSPLRAPQTKISEIACSRTGRWVIRRSYMVLMPQIATDYQILYSVAVRTAFGPSGLMQERIEKGERVDLFASADIGHPLKLRKQGRVTTVVMF